MPREEILKHSTLIYSESQRKMLYSWAKEQDIIKRNAQIIKRALRN